MNIKIEKMGLFLTLGLTTGLSLYAEETHRFEVCNRTGAMVGIIGNDSSNNEVERVKNNKCSKIVHSHDGVISWHNSAKKGTYTTYTLHIESKEFKAISQYIPTSSYPKGLFIYKKGLVVVRVPVMRDNNLKYYVLYCEIKINSNQKTQLIPHSRESFKKRLKSLYPFIPLSELLPKKDTSDVDAHIAHINVNNLN